MLQFDGYALIIVVERIWADFLGFRMWVMFILDKFDEVEWI